jgi:ssDNA-binding Zn-finger/Zn-ribbon topoisomerase 1
MAGPKIAKTADRERLEDQDAVPCPECGKPTRVVKRVKSRELRIAGGMYRSCSVCEFALKM